MNEAIRKHLHRWMIYLSRMYIDAWVGELLVFISACFNGEILFFAGMHFSQSVSIIQSQVGIIRGVQVLYSDTVSVYLRQFYCHCMKRSLKNNRVGL